MNNMEKILVSVIIPTYKRSKMLPRAIDSVLNQTYRNIQVVVVNDNNPNTSWFKDTSSLMEKYENDKRVKYICHEKNMNGSVARNTGIKESDGDIVAFLDDDDIYLPNKIEKQVQYLLDNPKFHAVYCGWDRDDKKIIPQEEGNLSYNILSGDHIIYTNVIMMWKKDAIQCGGWDETFKRHQEAAFLLRYFRCNGEIGVVPQILVKFDVSDRSNAALNPKVNENQTLHYLDSYKDIIKKCGEQNKGDDKKIWLHRYRGIFLNYIKSHDYKGAIQFFWKYCKHIPISFIFSLIEYISQRRKRISL